jgi:hypothetical protein
MGKRPVWFWFFTACVLITVLVVEIKPLHDAVWEWTKGFYRFAKTNIAAILAAFFLVKGKFVFKIFLKKILFISATGLGKRYLIERVFAHHFKIHFLDHIQMDMKRLFDHIKENFMRFPVTKKVIAGFAFLGSLGYVSKFMGVMLAVKVVLAKIWSFLLAVVLKAGGWVVYFFTDYIWGSWLAPIIEVVLFSWLLELLERVPFLTNSIRRLFRTSLRLFQWFERVLGDLFHHPVEKMFRQALKLIRMWIYRFIGYKRVPAYRQLRELREFEPNSWKRLQSVRKERAAKRKKRISLYGRRKQRKSD